MARTGSALFLAVFVATSAVAAEPELTMQADRDKVGLEDTFHLDVTVSNASADMQVTLPKSEDFEILGRSSSTQMSYSVGAGGAGVVTHLQRYTLTVRANRQGKLTIPGASITTSSGVITTKPVTLEVVPGRLQPERRRPPPSGANNPFGFPPGFFPPDMQDDQPSQPEELQADIPRGDSDLFIRASVDKTEPYAGEQVMLSIHLYSRVDLSTVDNVTMPKLDGFLSLDFRTPNQLVSEQRTIGGVPYREYLLRQKAIFPLKAGATTIDPPEADITTGLLFAGRRVHRKGNELKLTVRALPPGPATAVVGRWRLSREISQTEVALGEPLQVKLTIEGRGNLQSLTLPPLGAPSSFKVFDPETADKPNNTRAYVGGTRVIEYTLMPQQTGTFTLPAMTIPYFDPEARKYEEMRVDELTITVKPGANGATTQTVPGGPALVDPSVKNQLVASGLKSLRHTAKFSAPKNSLSTQAWFLPVALAPLLLTLLAMGFVFVKGSLGPESAESIQKRQAKAARKRLAVADELMKKGSTADFYAEVERALSAFISAKLGVNVAGMQRTELLERLTQAGLSEIDRKRIAHVLETCDLGRYAPGMGDASARKSALDEAARSMEVWS